MDKPVVFTYKEKLEKKIRIYSETIWKDKIDEGQLQKWLSNFKNSNAAIDEQEKINALYLLSKFMYFGNRETREMLKSVYRDKYQYKIIQNIRTRKSDTLDKTAIEADFLSELKTTRFLGIGNPSESGVHLLYYFRQENSLGRDNFINSHEIFHIDEITGKISLEDTSIKRYVFLDDFCGSGQQAIIYSRDIVSNIKKIDTSIKVSYYPIFATMDAVEKIKSKTLFDDVDPVFFLDSSYKCFESDSRYYKDCAEEPTIQQAFAKSTFEQYGKPLFYYPLGYNDCQLLLGFFHNTPDNTLPIFWSENDWAPFFKRYHKK